MDATPPPQPQELYETILRMAKAHDWLSLTIYFLVIYAPAILAALHTWHSHHKLEKLYKERLADKDAEIQRQAARIKDLEAQLLKRQRK